MVKKSSSLWGDFSSIRRSKIWMIFLLPLNAELNKRVDWKTVFIVPLWNVTKRCPVREWTRFLSRSVANPEFCNFAGNWNVRYCFGTRVLVLCPQGGWERAGMTGYWQERGPDPKNWHFAMKRTLLVNLVNFPLELSWHPFTASWDLHEYSNSSFSAKNQFSSQQPSDNLKEFPGMVTTPLDSVAGWI